MGSENSSKQTITVLWMMRHAYKAVKTGNWEGFKKEFQGKGKFSEWMYDRLKETFEKVALENIGWLSVAQDILRKALTS